MKSEEGVSEVIGFILIASIVIISLSFLIAVAFPVLNNVQEETEFIRGENSLSSLQEDMESVAMGPISKSGTGRTSSFKTGQGTLIIENSTGRITVKTVALNKTLKTGTIHFTGAQRDAWIENDLLARGKGKTSAPLKNNLLRVINVSDEKENRYLVSIHVLTIKKGSYYGSGEIVHISTTYEGFKEIYSDECENFTLEIRSPIPGAWKKFFKKELSKAGLREGKGFEVKGPEVLGERNKVKVTVEGTDAGQDVSLKLQQTTLALEIE